ncbi:MAG: NAD-dependent epimerase/dehydratase family protein, partial [Pediococcus pentosaceus]|nr:NAD-dependent epimerase/dehydratase family protein [Pediococcus pentosaceus]
MSILVVGGAGYIGSHMVKRLVEQNRDVVVVDNLSTGHRGAVDKGVKFYEGDIRDHAFLKEVFDQEAIDTVVHFAAFSIVPESMEKPLKYFDNNTAGMVALLEEMRDHDVKRIIFSSTAATYGVPEKSPIEETDRQAPINPYGESKLMMEKIIKWADQAYGIKFVALRYFNVAGAYPD